MKTARNKVSVFRTISVSLIVGFTMVVAAGALYQYWSEKLDRKTIPGELITVGDGEFHLLCKGVGSPVVILENGRWSSHPDWLDVIDGVQGTTRICSYDRLGMGWSSANPKPTRSVDVASNLSEVLAQAGMDEPVLLVGFSAGGIYARKYYELFPKQVLGIVFVDSAHEQGMRRMIAIPDGDLPIIKFCDAVAWTGVGRLLGLLEGRVPQHFSRERFEEQNRIYNQTRFCNGLIKAAIGFSLDSDAQSPPEPLGDLPIIVIEAGKPPQLGGVPDAMTAAFLADRARVWPQFQKEIAALSTNSEHWIANSSDHSIPVNQPAIVISAIKQLIASLNEKELLRR